MHHILRKIFRVRRHSLFALGCISIISVMNFLVNHVTVEIKTNIEWKQSSEVKMNYAEVVPGIPVSPSPAVHPGNRIKEPENPVEFQETENQLDSNEKGLQNNTHDLVPYSPITCDNCFQRNYYVMHTPRFVCDPRKDSPDIIAIILSAPRDGETRDIVRNTWLGFAHENAAARLRYVFLLGGAHTAQVQRAVDEEAAIYGDILQQYFYESYQNLTLKTLMGLEYAVKECPRARYVLKVDIDVFINVPTVMRLTEQQRTLSDVMGHCKWRVEPVRKEAHRKWYVSMDEYNQTVYPPYCEGPRYLVPMPAARAILRVSPNVPFFKMEDVYIGMALSLTEFRIKHVVGFYSQTKFNNKPVEEVECEKVARIVTTHRTNGHDMKMIWDKCFSDISLDLPDRDFYI